MLFRPNQSTPPIYRAAGRYLVLSLIILFATTLVISGCGTSKQPVAPSTSATTPGVDSQTQPPAQSTDQANPAPAGSPNSVDTKLTLYFPSPDATGLIAVQREVKVDNQDIIQAIFNELANPPAGLDNPLPKDTKLLSAKVADGIATIDLSQEFRQNFPGGSAGEQMTLYSIVDSLTALPNVQAVQFLLEGQKKDAILHEIDTTVPVKRNESLILQK